MDEAAEKAVSTAELHPLLDLEPALCDELLVSGREAWQFLAAAFAARVVRTDVLYADDPFGVFYLVGSVLATDGQG